MASGISPRPTSLGADDDEIELSRRRPDTRRSRPRRAKGTCGLAGRGGGPGPSAEPPPRALDPLAGRSASSGSEDHSEDDSEEL